MNRGELQLALRAIQARTIRDGTKQAKRGRAPESSCRTKLSLACQLGKTDVEATPPQRRNNGPACKSASELPRIPQAQQSPSSGNGQANGDSSVTPGMDSTVVAGFHEEDDERPRHVAKAGLTLRELYHLKRDADAWYKVCNQKLKEQQDKEKVKKTKAQEEKAAMAKFLDGQVARRKETKLHDKEDNQAYAKIVQQSVEMFKKEQEEALVHKLKKNAHYREEFREDIERIHQMKLRERQKKIAAEQRDMLKAKQEADMEEVDMRKKKEDEFLRMRRLQEEAKQQIKERALLRQREEEEISRLDREWAKGMEKKDKERHAAFTKILEKQAAKEVTFFETTQERIRNQLEADEARAQRWRQHKWDEQERKEQDKIQNRKAATLQQIKALELEKKIQCERKQQRKQEDLQFAKALIQRDIAAVKMEEERKKAARLNKVNYRKLLEEQMLQHQQRKQKQLIGYIQPAEMALNVSVFKEAGFLPVDAVFPQKGILKKR